MIYTINKISSTKQRNERSISMCESYSETKNWEKRGKIIRHWSSSCWLINAQTERDGALYKLRRVRFTVEASRRGSTNRYDGVRVEVVGKRKWCLCFFSMTVTHCTFSSLFYIYNFFFLLQTSVSLFPPSSLRLLLFNNYFIMRKMKIARWILLTVDENLTLYFPPRGPHCKLTWIQFLSSR